MNRPKHTKLNKWFSGILFMILLMCIQHTQAQTDSLNHRDSKGKKDGYWTVYLNEKLDPVDSISQASYIGYELYVNGDDVFSYHLHRWSFSYMSYETPPPKKGNPEILNGTFKWYDNKGLLRNEEIYKNGHPFFIKSYNWDSENPSISVFNEVLYFDKLLDGIRGTYYYEEYGYNNKLIGKYWFKKGKRGWRVYKINN